MQFDFIPQSDEWAQAEPVTAGWSGEEKYHIRARNGQEYLLRIADAAHRDLVRLGFDALRRLEDLPVPRAVSTGEFPRKVWVLLSWMPGTELEAALPALPEQRQFALGLQAGQVLRRLHSLPVAGEASDADWAARFNAKIDRKLRAYAACGLRYEDDAGLLHAVEALRPGLAGRPQGFQHGDYHIGNMLLSPEGGISVIDFNRVDVGDPWEEFSRVVWSAQASPSFASGQISGYFDGVVPDDFWRLSQLYIAVNALSSLPWAIPFGEREVETMRRQYRDIRGWYDDFRSIVPSWYAPRNSRWS